MRLLTVCLVVLSLVGCGDDGDSGGGGAVSTGLDEDQQLGDVSQDEAQDLCDTLAESAEGAISASDLARFPCTIEALSSPGIVMQDGTVDRAACEAIVSECLEDSPEPAQTAECDSAAVMAELAGCEATAGELEACLNASLPQIRSLLRLVSCSADLSQMPPEFAEPAACKALDMKCPGVLDVVGNVALPDLDLGDDGDDGETSTFDAGAP